MLKILKWTGAKATPRNLNSTVASWHSLAKADWTLPFVLWWEPAQTPGAKPPNNGFLLIFATCPLPSWFSTILKRNEQIDARCPFHFQRLVSKMSRSMPVSFLILRIFKRTWANPLFAGGSGNRHGGFMHKPTSAQSLSYTGCNDRFARFLNIRWWDLAVCALICCPFQLVPIITFWNRRIFQLADYHDAQLDEILLLVHAMEMLRRCSWHAVEM